MQFELSPSAESFIQSQLASGTYPSRIDCLEASVALLRQRQELVSRLQESRRQLDAGESQDFDEQGLHQLFEDLKLRSKAS